MMIASGATAFASGCAALSGNGAAVPGFKRRPAMAAFDLDPARLMRMTVCTRPFRPAGPRLEAENLDGRTLVHNYGHGGSGWSLSWGCAEEAAALVAARPPGPIAIIGAGVIGLTTALRLIETGAPVTIYAADFPSETRSARATGVWSPSSRIGLEDAVGDDFTDRFEGWARAAYARHQHYIGTLGDPVEFIAQYAVFDRERAPSPPAERDYLHLGRTLSGMTPPWSRLDETAHPFGDRRVRGGHGLCFNVAGYSEKLTRDFLARGGVMKRRRFADRAALLALDESHIVNCTGFGAKRLVEDETLIPVRGQINWLIPQAEARYSLYYNNVSAVSRRDGLVVQYTGPNDDYGFGDPSEIADRDEMETALARLRPLFPGNRSP